VTITWRCAPFAALTTAELYRILRLRQEVFVVEQTCPYLDADGRDADASHLWTDAADGARALACARLFAPGVRYAEACIGRVAAAHGAVPIRIGAQRYLERFYGELGFVTASPEYDEDGIPHVEMIRPG